MFTEKNDIETAICLFFRDASGVPETAADEIITDRFINFFAYAEAKAELIHDGFVSHFGGIIKSLPKGDAWADEFGGSLPPDKKTELIASAQKLKKETELKKVCRTSVTGEDWIYVNAEIGDADSPVLKLSLYAPDTQNAEKIETAIKSNPFGIYKKIIRIIEKTEA
ncbi:MAG: DUF4364 family protein [Ruminococcus sp.]|jgi:hypothetical protein|nr:DUF4364 family protein [Ruminococcus sp.]